MVTSTTTDSPGSTVDTVSAVKESSGSTIKNTTTKNTTKNMSKNDEAAEAAEEPSTGGDGTPEAKNNENNDSTEAVSTGGEQKGAAEDVGLLSPTPQPQLYGYPAHLTPGGYYGEPPSPARPGANVYDVGSFFQQPYSSPFVPGTPSSPRGRNVAGIPPASPLFPRVNTAAGPAGFVPGASGMDQRLMGAPPSPSVPYLTPPLGPNSMYHGYPANTVGGHSDSPEDIAAWGERNNMFPPGSPQVNAQGLPVPYVPGMGRAGRAYSFDDPTGMLPPVADPDQGNYSPYGGVQGGMGAGGGTLFSNQQPFGYGGPGDMYGTPGSPLQPRPVAQMPGYPGHPMGGGMRQMGLYGQYYPATSPGPPIQTTESNKGPDGANLFIFHIPNHFTNLDMYQLFCPYGNLLSVRIMVEKDTGRSRGFGFVSYDSPASAALAIKDLNGFSIGNKRLKVQHKQIRPSDQEPPNHGPNFFVGVGGQQGNFYQQRGGHGAQLPPSGPMAAMGPGSPWAQGAIPGDDGAQGGTSDINTTDNNPEDSSANVGLGSPDGALSPLASLEPLRNALPDVAGND